ncbi:hypothetical protein BGY98DRAFT_1010699, partial [Russula aff. rugulosa BPL654]
MNTIRRFALVLVFVTNFHPAHKGTSIGLRTSYSAHTVCGHCLVFANLCDRLKRGFTYQKHKEDRSLLVDNRVAYETVLMEFWSGVTLFRASVQREGALEMDGRTHGWQWALEKGVIAITVWTGWESWDCRRCSTWNRGGIRHWGGCQERCLVNMV